MKTSKTAPALVAASACVLGLVAGLHVPAAEAYNTRARYFRPSGICEAPLPVYDMHLRKAPMRVDNIGNEAIFINCAVPTDPVGDIGAAWFEVHFRSSTTAARRVDCTLVTGTADAPVFDTKTVTLLPNANSWLTWHAIDKGGADGLLAIQCVLPPGIQLTHLYAREYDAGQGI